MRTINRTLTEDVPPSLNRITRMQMYVLGHILMKSYRQASVRGLRRFQAHPVKWSTKEFLGRSPTKAEAASFSRRVSNLVSHGLLIKVNGFLKVTSRGKLMIRTYLSTGKHDFYMNLVRLSLDMYEGYKRLLAIQTVMRIAGENGSFDSLISGRGMLRDLYEDESKRLEKLIEQQRQLMTSHPEITPQYDLDKT